MQAENTLRSALPPTTLVIPSRNREQLLFETLESVLAGDAVPDEIVAVDQSDQPSDAIRALAASTNGRVRYCWTAETGLSKARNRGIREARHDLLLFVDDDVRVTSSWYTNLTRALYDAGEGAAVTGRVLPEADHDDDTGFVPSTIDDPEPAVYEGRIGMDILYPNNMALWRSTIEAVGPFDERLGMGTKFRAAEDNEFAFRLLECGYQIRYVPEAVVYHRSWRTWADYNSLCWNYGYGQGAYYAKHLGLRDRHMLSRFRYDLVQRSRRAMQFARRHPHRALGQFAYMGGMVVGGVRWLLSEARRS